MANITVEKNRYTTESLYQWDLNQVLQITGLSLPSAPTVHFTNTVMDRAIARPATMNSAGVITVDVPNSLLQVASKITVYIGIYEGESFRTLYSVVIPVKARNKPGDYVLTMDDDEVYSFTKLEALVNDTVTKWDADIKTLTKKCDDNLKALTEEGEANLKELQDLVYPYTELTPSTSDDLDDILSTLFDEMLPGTIRAAYLTNSDDSGGLPTGDYNLLLYKTSAYSGKIEARSVPSRRDIKLVRLWGIVGLWSEWLYENPEFDTLNVEYPTTERYMGETVYVKRVIINELPSEDRMSVDIFGEDGYARIVDFKGWYHNSSRTIFGSFPWVSSEGISATAEINDNRHILVIMNINTAGVTTLSGEFIVKFIKI